MCPAFHKYMVWGDMSRYFLGGGGTRGEIHTHIPQKWLCPQRWTMINSIIFPSHTTQDSLNTRLASSILGSPDFFHNYFLDKSLHDVCSHKHTLQNLRACLKHVTNLSTLSPSSTCEGTTLMNYGGIASRTSEVS